MTGTKTRLYALALLAGFLLVPVRMALSFFPLFNVAEIALFAAAAAALAYAFRTGPALWVVPLCLPALLSVAYVAAAWLGAENLRRGVGLGHLVSLLVIPISALIGAYCGNHLRLRLPDWRGAS